MRRILSVVMVLAALAAMRPAVAAPATPQVPARGLWLEARLWAAPPWAVWSTAASTVGFAASGGNAPFEIGYKLGRLHLALGFDVVQVSVSGGTQVGASAVWLAPTVGYTIVQAVRRRPALYVEGALHVLAGGSGVAGQPGSTLAGYGIRGAFGGRDFVAPGLALGLEAGLDYDTVSLSTGFPQGSASTGAFSLYGAVTLVLVIG